MEKDERDEVEVSPPATEQTRREMLRMVGAAIAAGSVGIIPTDTEAQTPVARATETRAENRASAVIQRIINDPKLLNQVEIAKTGSMRRSILARAGLNSESNPRDVQAAVMQILATHGREGGKITPHVIGENDWGSGSAGAERVVEWVAAVAALIAA
jgi:hypothetical protein